MSGKAGESFERYTSEGKLALMLGSTIGRLQLRKMKNDGLPDCLEKPFEFLINRSLTRSDLQVIHTIEGMRAAMAKRCGEFVAVFSEGADIPGSQSPGREFDTTRLRSLTEIARISSVHPLWGTFLFLCAKTCGARTILELGGAAGISGCYLASSPTCKRFITVEGNEARANLAKSHLQQVSPSAEVVMASFDKGLNTVLPTLHEKLDLVYFDGSKQRQEILALFSRLTPYFHSRCLIIFDDIHWSAEMRKTWDDICRQPGIRFAINVGRMGVCLWEGGNCSPMVFTLFKLAGLDIYGMRYRLHSWISNRFPGPHLEE